MISAAVASVCLVALQWMLWGTAALLGLLLAVQALRGDADAQPIVTGLSAVGAALLGWACGAVGRRLAPRERGL